MWEKLDPENIPGDPWRAVPNYNGYQPDAEGNLVFNPDSYVAATSRSSPIPRAPQDHREGCMYDPQWDVPILSTTSQNGGADWSNNSYSHSTNLVYFPYGTNPVAHWNGARRTASERSGSTRPAASSPTTPRPARSRGRTISAPTCRTGRAR